MVNNNPLDLKRHQIFISYSHNDRDIANKVAKTLRSAGLKVWIDIWDIKLGDSIHKSTQQGLESSDILLLLLSPDSVKSKWVQQELEVALTRELQFRSITVIPALIADCEIPIFLSDKSVLDLRHNRSKSLQLLTDQINSIKSLDYSKLDSKTFEEMVSDLLEKLGFNIQKTTIIEDLGFDFIATYRFRDPFGSEKITTWLVESKFYQDDRVGVSSLQKIMDSLYSKSINEKGLIVTNGRLTSVARSFLSESTLKLVNELRVIDGTELTGLLIQHFEIIQKYFPEDSINE